MVLTDGSVVSSGTLSIGGSGEVEIQKFDSNWASPENYGATFDSGLIVSGGGNITVDSGANLTFGTATVNDIQITDKGSITVSGTLSVSSTVNITSTGNPGGTIVNNGAIDVGTPSGSAGTLNIGAGITLTLEGSNTSISNGANATGSARQFRHDCGCRLHREQQYQWQ